MGILPILETMVIIVLVVVVAAIGGLVWLVTRWLR